MKKKWKITILVFVAIIGVFFLTPMRYYNPPLEGAGGYSDNIEESKERGVFLFEYKIKNNPIHLQNGRILHIQEAWVEKAWMYPVNCPEITRHIINHFRFLLLR